MIGSHFINIDKFWLTWLSESLNSNLNLVIKIVNRVKCIALNTNIFNELYKKLHSDYQTLIYHTKVC